jgi:hypothetical protein
LRNELRIELSVVKSDGILQPEVVEIISVEADASIGPERASRE